MVTKRFFAWIVAICMMVSMIPLSTFVAVAKTYSGVWITEELSKGEHVLTVNSELVPTGKVVIGDGVTLTVKGIGTVTTHGGNIDGIFEVQRGGHLILDDVTLANCGVGEKGAVYVAAGGALDLGYNDQDLRLPPAISGNSYNHVARNLVVEQGATVRLNGYVSRGIGVSYAGSLQEPVALIQGGRYDIQTSDFSNAIDNNKITLDNASNSGTELVLNNDHIVLTAKSLKILHWDPTKLWHNGYNNNQSATDYYDGIQKKLTEVANATVDVIQGTSKDEPKHLDDDAEKFAKLLSYDLIFMNEPNVALNETEKAKLLEYLNAGGRIFILGELGSFSVFQETNQQIATSTVALGGGYTLPYDNQLTGVQTATIESSGRAATLMQGVTSLSLNVSSRVLANEGTQGSVTLSSYQVDGVSYPWLMDQFAGDKNGEKWGAMSIAGNSDWIAKQNGDSAKVMQNLTQDAHANRITAAAGVNPNTTVAKQVKNETTSKEYATLKEALGKADRGQTVALTQEMVTAEQNLMLFNGATLKTVKGQTYQAAVKNTYLDVASDGGVTLRQGELAVGANAPLTVPGAEGKTHTVEADHAVTVTVPDSGGGGEMEPTLRSENGGAVTIDGVTYTYQNPDAQHQAVLSIPDAMENNDDVTKAEAPAGKTVKAGGAAGEVKADAGTITVERANGTVEVKVPKDGKATAFGYTVETQAQDGVTLKPASEKADDAHKDRPTVTATAGQTFTVGEHTYTATAERTVFYLGKFTVTVAAGDNTTATPADTTVEKYYGDTYEVIFAPKDQYDLKKDQVRVTVNGARDETAAVQEGANVKVTVTVTGETSIVADPDLQTTVISVTKTGNGTVTASYTDAAGQKQEQKTVGDSITVQRNTKVDLTFTPAEGDADSVSVLTGLKLGGADKFADAKDSFDWSSKGYSYSFTPDVAEQTMEATFTKMHVVTLNVTGATATLPQNALTDAGKTLVQDGQGLTVTFAKTADIGDHPYITATVNGESWELSNDQLTLQSVTAPRQVVVMYEQGYLLTVTAENGTLDTGTGKWTAEQNQQKTVVKAGGALTLRFTPGVGNGLKRLNKDGVDDTAKAVKQEDGTVTYRLEGISKDTVVAATFDTLYTVTFVDAAGKAIGAEQVVKDQTLTAERFAHYAELAKVDGKAFFTWQRKGTQEIVNSRKAVTESLELTPVYKDRVGTGTETGTDGLQAVIGADHFAVNVADVAGLTKEAVLERAVAEAIGKDGVKLQAGAITVGQLDALQGLQQAGNVNLTLTAEDASVTVAVTVVDVAPVMMGRTAYTISFTGEPNTEYTVAAETGTPVTVLTDGTGKGVAENLTKGTAYTIGSPIYGKTTAKTSGEDAKEIAEKFKTGTEETVTSGAGGDQEQASNDNVLVTVGSDGNYLVTLKQDVNRSVVVADNWGAITIDLNGNTIKGDDATARGAAKSGLEFAAGADDGTDVTIVDTKGGGKVQGGNGLPQYPDGAAGIGVATGAPEGSAVTVGEHAAVVGGAGATNENGAGGSGGAGIAGAIPVTVDGGKVNGGAGGAGAPGAEGKISGLGGRGGTGIQVDKQDVTVKKGTVTGGQGGTGGDDADGTGGDGGTGGVGIDVGTGTVAVEQDGVVSGGRGGHGGAGATAGNGGTGGQGVVGTSTGNGTILAGADGMHGDLKLSEIAIGRLGTGNVLATYTDGSGVQRVDEPVTGSSIFVMRNTNVTLKFVGQDLGKTRAVSKDFTILTALNVDATSVELEGTMEFDWTDKSYTYDLNAGNRGHVVEAVFRNAHLVEVEISGATVTFPQGVKVNGNRAIVLEGDSLTLALTPDEALGILPVAKATLNGAEVTLGNDYTYTIQNIAGSQVFQVEFGKHPFVETVITEVTETSIGFIGEANAQYTVQEEDLYIVVMTDANGAGLVTGLKPGTEYTITHPVHGAVKGRTLVGNAIGTSEKGQMTETAKTGDSTNIIFSVALGAVAVAYAAIVLLKRRRTR